MKSSPRLLHVALVADGDGVMAAPGAVLLDGGTIVATGAPSAIGHVAGVPPEVLPRTVIVPGLVNCHAHLDLSHVGTVPYDGDFMAWITMVMGARRSDPAAVAESVDTGVQLALAGGCAAVGDIAGAGSLVPLTRLRASPLVGVSYVEFFGQGSREDGAIDAMKRVVHDRQAIDRGVRLGLQPHAPYSCSPRVYLEAARMAARHDLPISTHLAETPEEFEFLEHGTGPFAAFLARLGIDDARALSPRCRPVAAVAEAIRTRPFVLAHVNSINEQEIDLLRGSGSTVAYCPRASTYFGHRDHPWARLRAAGVPVALGTDSLICLDTPGRIGILDEMRLLLLREGAPAPALLEMATVTGAAGLGLDPARFTLRPGRPAGILAIDLDDEPRGGAVDRLRAAIAVDAPPRWIVAPESA